MDTIFENIWYGHHQAFFSVNSVVTVIMSSGHYIWKYMIWSSSGIIFQCEFSCNGDYVIQRHHFSFYKIQDKVFKLVLRLNPRQESTLQTASRPINIQDKEAHSRWCQGKDPSHGSKIKNNVLMSRPKSTLETMSKLKSRIINQCQVQNPA